MKLYNSNENWRELLCPAIDKAEAAAGEDRDACYYGDYADELCRLVMAELQAAGVSWQNGYQQSAGAFEIVQSALPEERAAFDAAVEKHLPKIEAELIAAESATNAAS